MQQGLYFLLKIKILLLHNGFESVHFAHFFSGTDTVLTAQLWVFLYMAAFPDIQADIQAQIDQVVGHHRMPTLQDEKALSLLSKF